MKLFIANPLYDSVFKYLMEDERIAKTILSALLKKEVVSLKVRPHEYANIARNDISMFRIDFGATVREADGTTHMVLIELQKTWVETETLRFRQYLGSQYLRKENMQDGADKRFAIPMVAVYLLGHRVGDITEPVVYVDHKAYDYNGNEVTKGMPDPFVDSLVHNSIIVQIPLLHGQVNNRLEKVLSVFDQDFVYPSDPHVMALDGSKYAGDTDMEYIIRRLQSAAADPDLRQDMNVEDEYFKAIEDRDTTLMAQSKRIKAQDDRLKAQDKQIEAKDNRLKAQDKQLKAQDKQIEAKDNRLKAQDKRISDMETALRNTAKALMEKGFGAEDVARVTGLPVADIRRMASEAGA